MLVAAILVSVPLVAGWFWLGIKLVGEPHVRVWFWFGGALILAYAGYEGHKFNMKRAAEPGYLLQDTSGIVVLGLHPTGQVSIGSELWTARTRGEHLEVGTRIKVYGREGIVLLVEAWN